MEFPDDLFRNSVLREFTKSLELIKTPFCSLNHSLCNLAFTNLSFNPSLLWRDLNIVSDLVVTNLFLDWMFKLLLGAKI
jgi:hypothetical protein